jgi:NAD(P)-dependent dehydrogenase (short-subunit alcohol dehydrogenase family)
MITYLDEHTDAHDTAALVQAEGRRCITLASDVRSQQVRRVRWWVRRTHAALSLCAEKHRSASPPRTPRVRPPLQACQAAVSRCVSELGKLDILVNNAAVQHSRKSITEVTDEIIQQVCAVGGRSRGRAGRGGSEGHRGSGRPV